MILSTNHVILRLKYIKIVTNWSCVDCIRMKSSIEPKTKTYSHTILTPKTNFPVRSTKAIKDSIQKVN